MEFVNSFEIQIREHYIKGYENVQKCTKKYQRTAVYTVYNLAITIYSPSLLRGVLLNEIGQDYPS